MSLDCKEHPGVQARLVLVTANYPYALNGGEVMFVAPELHRLARELGAAVRITVVPLHADGKASALPLGVELDTRLALAMRRQRLTAWLRAPGWPGFWPELWRGLRCGGAVGGVRVWRWAAVAQVTWRWAVSAFADMDEATAQVFYTYWRGGSTLALARLAHLRRRSAAISRVHRYELYESAFDPPFQPWHPAMYGALAITATISQHGFDYLRAAGVPEAQLGLYRLGTEPAARAARASADGTFRIVSCSNATPVKRVPRIAEAVIAFARAHPSRAVRWTHFGAGPELARVQAMVVDAPGNLSVKLPGAVANQVVLDHYAGECVDVFLLLSASEGLPMSIQEAASAAIPVIASDVGGVGELVGGDNGALLAANPTRAEVVTALESVLLDGDPSRRLARREASRLRWVQGFDAEANHTRFARRLGALVDELQSTLATRGTDEI